MASEIKSREQATQVLVLVVLYFELVSCVSFLLFSRQCVHMDGCPMCGYNVWHYEDDSLSSRYSFYDLAR